MFSQEIYLSLHFENTLDNWYYLTRFCSTCCVLQMAHRRGKVINTKLHLKCLFFHVRLVSQTADIVYITLF